MPLPNDEKLIALSEEILKQFEAMFGSHPGFRPGHAKGILLTGTFTPSVRQRR
jgi:Catalase.